MYYNVTDNEVVLLCNLMHCNGPVSQDTSNQREAEKQMLSCLCERVHTSGNFRRVEHAVL